MIKTYTGSCPATSTKSIVDINELVGLANGVKVLTVRTTAIASGADIVVNGRDGNAPIAGTASAGVISAGDVYLSNNGYEDEMSAYGMSIVNRGSSAIMYYIAIEDTH